LWQPFNFPAPSKDTPPFKNVYADDAGWRVKDLPELLIKANPSRGWCLLAREDIPMNKVLTTVAINELRGLHKTVVTLDDQVRAFSPELLDACYGVRVSYRLVLTLSLGIGKYGPVDYEDMEIIFLPNEGLPNLALVEFEYIDQPGVMHALGLVTLRDIVAGEEVPIHRRYDLTLTDTAGYFRNLAGSDCIMHTGIGCECLLRIHPCRRCSCTTAVDTAG
jgi:hypothetical protein